MTTDTLKPIRDHLVVACTLLAGSSERTEELSNRVRAVERQMDWRGDASVALYALPAIIVALGDLKAGVTGPATGTTQLTQDAEPELLPGIADAITQLEKAVSLLIHAV